MIVAVDGPAGAGKGTLARRLATHYGLAYLDTGALYRAVARDALKAGVDLDDPAAAGRVAEKLDPATLDDPALRTGPMGEAASRVAAHEPVRAALLQAQRDFAAQAEHGGGAVLDGRDIASVVCPDADVKLFVTAAPRARAARRAKELAAAGEPVDEAALALEIAQRDARDAERQAAPMIQAPGARLLDTTELSIDAAFDAARRLVDEVLASRPG